MGNPVLGKNFKTFIIAEAGVNHNGSLELAEKLVDAAAWAGSDAVKFQTFKAERLATKTSPKARYQMQSTVADESQIEMLRKLELDEESHKTLFDRAKDKGIQFISSAFDLESIEFLDALGVEIFKIPSGEITNLPYLRKIGSLGKKTIISTGMTDLGEIEDALIVLTKAGLLKEHITVLHCNTEYPTPFEDVNLLAMQTIATAFDVSVGYSDHSLDIEVPIAAVALGACVIEKHFTLDKNMLGPDHKASLNTDELKNMIIKIRNVEKALGTSHKMVSPSELKNRKIVRKSIVASTDIEKGEVFSEKNITVKRPAIGLNPMLWDEVIGKTSPREFKKDEPIAL
jgi:N,N'-diacetyllegionaminate synthase